MMPSYLILAFASFIFFSLDTVLSKYVVKFKVSSPFVVSFFNRWSRFGIACLIILFSAQSVRFPDQRELLIICIYAGSLFLGYLSFLRAIKTVDVSVASPLFMLRTFFATAISAIFLIERYSVVEYLLLGALLPLAVLVAYNTKLKLRSFFTRDIGFLLVYFFFLAIVSVAANRGQTSLDFWSFVFWAELVGAVLNLIFVPTVVNFFKKGNSFPWIMLLVGLVALMGSFLQTKALAGNVTVTTAIISIPGSLVLVIILGLFKPRLLEENPWWVYALRVLAAACSVGIVLVLGLGLLR